MHSLLVSALVVLLVGTWWVFVLWLLSELSGWRKVAVVYRAQRPPNGKRFSMQTGKIGDIWYKRCLTVYTSGEGLYVSLWPVFRFRQPALFIPWSAVRDQREKRFLLSRLIEFDVGSPRVATIRLSPPIFRDRPIA
jgi:hypothetical protein